GNHTREQLSDSNAASEFSPVARVGRVGEGLVVRTLMKYIRDLLYQEYRAGHSSGDEERPSDVRVAYPPQQRDAEDEQADDDRPRLIEPPHAPPHQTSPSPHP